MLFILHYKYRLPPQITRYPLELIVWLGVDKAAAFLSLLITEPSQLALSLAPTKRFVPDQRGLQKASGEKTLSGRAATLTADGPAMACGG